MMTFDDFDSLRTAKARICLYCETIHPEPEKRDKCTCCHRVGALVAVEDAEEIGLLNLEEGC